MGSYVVNDPERMQQLAAAGLWGFVTDIPDVASAALGPRPPSRSAGRDARQVAERGLRRIDVVDAEQDPHLPVLHPDREEGLDVDAGVGESSGGIGEGAGRSSSQAEAV